MPRASDIRAAKALVRLMERRHAEPPQWAVNLSKQKPTKVAKPADDEHHKSPSNEVHRSGATGKFVSNARAAVANARAVARSEQKVETNPANLTPRFKSAADVVNVVAPSGSSSDAFGIDVSLQRVLTDLSGEGWRVLPFDDSLGPPERPKLWTFHSSRDFDLPPGVVLSEVLESQTDRERPHLLLVRDGEVKMVRIESNDSNRVSLFQSDLLAASTDDLPVGDPD